jgi:hypothetical protein
LPERFRACCAFGGCFHPLMWVAALSREAERLNAHDNQIGKAATADFDLNRLHLERLRCGGQLSATARGIRGQPGLEQWAASKPFHAGAGQIRQR